MPHMLLTDLRQDEKHDEIVQKLTNIANVRNQREKLRKRTSRENRFKYYAVCFVTVSNRIQ